MNKAAQRTLEAEMVAHRAAAATQERALARVERERVAAAAEATAAVKRHAAALDALQVMDTDLVELQKKVAHQTQTSHMPTLYNMAFVK